MPAKSPLINLVGIDCKPEDEQKFVKWYDEVHIPLLLQFKGLRSVKRYEIANGVAYPKYLAIFEFESKKAFEAYEKSPELAAALADRAATWKENRFEVKWRAQYEQLKSWDK